MQTAARAANVLAISPVKDLPNKIYSSAITETLQID
jgi:hypothetical protein